MKTSDSIGNLSKALAAAQGMMKNPPADKEVVVKHKSGGEHRFKYAQLTTCYDVTREALSKNGLSHFSAQIPVQGGTLISTRLAHESGEWVESSMVIPSQGDPKELAGAISYFRRYQFNGLVGIAGDDDLDDNTTGNQGGGRQGSRQRQSEPKEKKAAPPKPTYPGDFVLHLGSLANKRIQDCDMGQLQQCREFLSGQPPEKMGERDNAALCALNAFFAAQERAE